MYREEREPGQINVWLHVFINDFYIENMQHRAIEIDRLELVLR